MTIELELTPELLGNLRVLVVAGAKSPQTGEDAIMAAAQLLQIMHKAANAAAAQQPAKPNGPGAEAPAAN